MEKSPATLLRRYPLGETSLIIHWCTTTHGLVKTVAKGARTPKSPFAGTLDIFVDAEIAWSPSRKSDLHHLREAGLLAPRLGLRTRWPRTLAASYFVALVELVAERETPIADLHHLLQRALDWLADHEPSPAAVRRFEDRIAALLGIAPPGGAGAAAILHTFHRLPPQRASLILET